MALILVPAGNQHGSGGVFLCSLGYHTDTCSVCISVRPGVPGTGDCCISAEGVSKTWNYGKNRRKYWLHSAYS